MKIGLMGFEFASANKGCEALVYSFLSIIIDKLDDESVVYNFSGSDLGLIPSYFQNIRFVNVYPKLKDVTFTYLKALKKCDIIFDVTMGDSLSDIYSKPYYDRLIRHKLIAEKLCKKYILLPQTYGPFKHETSADKAKKVFDKAYKIYCRDEMSQKLLEDKFNIHNSILASDMAFILPYDKGMYYFSDNKKVGLNISGLLYKGGFHTENQFGLSLNYPELVDRIISDLMQLYEVHLIPHVIDLKEDSYDDDYKTCEMLHKKFPDTILAPAFDTPIEAKSYISNMDIFIGSRMHSTIASFSSGVVTIPISYSRKFEGLFGSLNYRYVVNAKEENTESAHELILKFINEHKQLSKVQSESMKIVNQKNVLFKESLARLFKEA